MANFLGVGIHQNVVVSKKTGMNDKGTLELHLLQVVEQTNFLEAFDGDGNMGGSEGKFLLFPVDVTDFEKKQKSPSTIATELFNFKANMTDILKVYMTSDKATAAISSGVMFANLGITAENQATIPERLLSQEFVTAIYNNICRAFLVNIAPYMEVEAKFRVKIRRTSKNKHFGMIPPRGQGEHHWIESMMVPQAQSKVVWQEWEIKKGYNSGEKAAEATPAEADQAKVNSAFAAPAAAPAQAAVAQPVATTGIPVNGAAVAQPVQAQPVQVAAQPVQQAQPAQPVQQPVQTVAQPVQQAQPVAQPVQQPVAQEPVAQPVAQPAVAQPVQAQPVVVQPAAAGVPPAHAFQAQQ